MEYESCRNSARILSLLLMTVLTVLLLVSCLSPLDESVLNQVKDETPPTITIISPLQGSSYAATVIVTGIVRDVSADPSQSGRIHSLSFEIIGTSVGGEISCEEDGSFTFQFSTTGLSGSLEVRLSAEDWNGTKSEVVLTLIDEGAIPSFSVLPGNTQVTVAWNPVPLSTSYTLYYTTNGTLPTEEYGHQLDDVQSPLTITDLENGQMHVFRLKSHSSSGEDNWSDYARAIPLGSTTLAPTVKAQFGKIILEWAEIPGTDEFEIEKSTSRGGPFTNISGTLRGNTLTDTDVSNGQSYYYRVRPTLEGSIVSEAVSSEAGFFPFGGCIRRGTSAASTSNDVAVKGNFAYLATDINDLIAIDITDPRKPVQTADLDVQNCREIAVSGDYIYASKASGTYNNSGFWVIDITSPATPVYANSVTGFLGEHIAVEGDYAYVADAFTSIEIFDISGSPQTIYQHPAYPISGGYDLAVENGYAFSAEGSFGDFLAINVSDPDSPYQADSLAVFASAVDASGNYAYTLGGSDIRVIDVSDPEVAGMSEVSSLTIGFSKFIDVVDQYAYVSQDSTGVKVIDVSNPLAPLLIARLDTARAVRATGSGNYLYVADRYEGLVIGEIIVPASPSVVDSVSGFYAYDVHREGDYAYVAASGQGFQVVDVSTPGSMGVVGSVSGRNARGVDVCGSYAFLADDRDGLKIIDISDPTDPSLVSTFGAYWSYDVVVRGGYAFIADYSEGIKVIDISDPLSPRMVGLAATNPYAEAIALEGDYAYVVGYNDFSIVDISDLSAPFEIPTSVITLNRPHDIEIWGDYAYVADEAEGLKIIDISDPQAPQLVNSYDTVFAEGLDVIESYVVLGDKTAGIKIIDVFNPTAPVEIASAAAGDAFRVFISGKFAYVADGGYGIKVIQLAP